MVWTYDPLETRNGYLNLCKLGGYVRTYLPDYYGEMKDKLNAGLPSDRFLLEWDLDSDRARCVEAGEMIRSDRWEKYPMLYTWDKVGEFPLPSVDGGKDEVNSEGFLLPVPASIQDMKSKNMEAGMAWRFASREGFEELFSYGYIVVGLLRKQDEPINYYVLEKKR